MHSFTKLHSRPRIYYRLELIQSNLRSNLHRLKTRLNRSLHSVQNQLGLPTDRRPILVRLQALLNTRDQPRKLSHHARLLRKIRRNDVLARTWGPSSDALVETRPRPRGETRLVLLERDDEIVDVQSPAGPGRGDVHCQVRQERAVKSGRFPVLPVEKRPARQDHARLVSDRAGKSCRGLWELESGGEEDRSDAVPPGVSERAVAVQIGFHPDVVLQEVFASGESKARVSLKLSPVTRLF